MEANMATRIRFKRGETDVVKSYIDAYVGEPLYDLETGSLYVKKEDGEIFPVSGVANIVNSLPTFNASKHTGRTIYDSSTNLFYFGTDTKWQHTTPEYCNEHKDVDLSILSSVPLDFHDDLALGTINLNGELTQDTEVTFPQKHQVYIVTNNTTGEYSVTLKVTGGSGEGVEIDQGLTIMAFNNSTNIVYVSRNDFDQKTTDFTRELLKKETAATTRGHLNLGTASTLNWGSEIGNLVQLIDNGYGEATIPPDLIKQIYELVITPQITAPADGVGGLDPGSVTVNGDPYVCIYSAYTRDYRKFQIKEDGNDWSTLIIDHDEDVDSKEFTTLDPSKNYVCRIKDVNIKGYESNWSEKVTFNTSDVYVETPDLTIESLGENATISPMLTGTSFSVVGTSSSHDYTDWMIERVSDGSVVWSSLNDTTNLTSIQVPINLEPSTNYEFSVRYADDDSNISAWKIVTLTTIDVMIDEPVLEVETASETDLVFREDVLLTVTSDFSITPDSFLDIHHNTDWRVKTQSDNVVVWSSLNDTENKTSIRVDSDILETDTTYIFEVRFRGQSYGTSTWGSQTKTTQESFDQVLAPESTDETTPQDPTVESYGGSGWSSSVEDGYYSTKIDEEPITMYYNGTELTKSSDVSSLNFGEWGFGNVDGLSYSALYVRLPGDADPNTEDLDDIQVLPSYSTKDIIIGGSYTYVNGGGSPGYYLSERKEEPITIYYNGTELTKSSNLGSLGLNEWGFGDVDSIGEDRIYMRLPGDVDPNSQDLDDIQLQPELSKDKENIGGISYVNSGFPGYYLNASVDEPMTVSYNGSELTKNSTVNNLNPGEWGFGDVDGIGEDRIYMRLPGDVNPSTVDRDLVQYQEKEYWDTLYSKGSQFAFLGYPYNHYGTKIEVYDMDGIKVYEDEQLEEFDPADYSSSDQIPAQSSGSALVTASGDVLNAYKLFDKNEVQYWQISGNTGWVKYEFDTKRRPYLISYSLTIRDTISSPTQAPKDFRIQGSVGGTDWTDLDIQTEVDDWTGGETKTFIINPVSGTGYRYYRLMISDNNGYGNTELSQIRLYTHTEYNYNEIVGVNDLTNIDPNTSYKIRIGYNTNEPGFTNYIFGSDITVTTGDTIESLVNKPVVIYPEDGETEVGLSPELESSNFDSGLIDSLDQLQYEIFKTSDDTVVYSFITEGIVNQPTNIYPDGQTNVTLSPELESSDFSYTGSDDTLDEREYIVRKSDDSSIVYTSNV